MVIGHEKGSDTESRIKHNFGMAMPEGYRKAVRLMEMADRFGLPVITFVDTAGAYPGIGAEERGQAEAIARSTDCCLSLGVPIVSVIIGEGGSGGAVAIATANRILMLEHAIYSVISPEGAASIIWRDSAKKEEAATAMKITAQDLEELGVIDGIISEPVGGAHRDPKQHDRRTRHARSPWRSPNSMHMPPRARPPPAPRPFPARWAATSWTRPPSRRHAFRGHVRATRSPDPAPRPQVSGPTQRTSPEPSIVADVHWLVFQSLEQKHGL